MKLDKFTVRLDELAKEYGVVLLGTLRVHTKDGYSGKTTLDVTDTVTYGGLKDSTGPFLVCNAQRKRPSKKKTHKVSTSFGIIDREKPMGGDGGIESPVDGKVYTNRHSYETHLKDNNCHVVTDSAGRRSQEATKRTEKTKQELKNSGDFSWG